MTKPVLMMGDHALAESALRAGCNFFAGYPITPQSEILEYMAARMPAPGRVFVQAESEWEAIMMVYGAAAVGARAMTSSVGTAWTLMFEGLGHLVACQVPAVVVDVNRLGPGEGQLPPAQSDYKMATKGGHGDAHWIVLAPGSVQEIADLTVLGFELADRYRNPVMMLVDGMTAMSMESVVLPEPVTELPDKPWAATGVPGRERLEVGPYFGHGSNDDIIELNAVLQAKYRTMADTECRWEEKYTDDADVVIIAFGLAARTAHQAVLDARARGERVGLLRPITVWPFPSARVAELAEQVDALLVAEMNLGQMIDDVRAAVQTQVPIHHLGQACWPIYPDQFAAKLDGIARGGVMAAAAV
jgi:2-oxoglutarate ferredoxin oxidoreductase subunit alpha